MTIITTNEVLQLALEGLEYQKRGVEENISKIRLALAEIDGVNPAVAQWNNMNKALWGDIRVPISKRSPGRPRKIAVPVIIENQEAFYKGLNAGKRKHHHMSAEGKARIIAATKKRWAAWRKAKKAGVK